MKLSRLAALAGILVWVAAGCVGNVAPGNGVTGTGGGSGAVCSAGLTMCSGACVNTSSNASNCGGCGKACANGQVCDGGKCSSSCSAGTMLCGSSCATVATDPAHCGNCTTTCRADQTCNGGACVCPAGTTLCPSGTCAASCGGTGSGGATGSGGSGSGGSPPLACNTPMPGRAPLRRLSAFEYNNTVKDLLQDTTNPGNDLPSEAIGNGFGNNADEQSVSNTLAEGYGTVAAAIAGRATKDATALGKLASCASNVTAAMEESCATTIINTLLPRAFRRTVTAAEQTDYLALYKSVRALNTSVTFASGVAAVIEAVLQAPDFLYRVEFGTPDPANPSIKKLTPREIATRLSYFFWQTMPDPALTTAADGNMLSTPAQVMAQATRLLNDPSNKAHPMVAFFFDNVLPLPILTDLARDKDTFPTFSPTIGQQMRQETQRAIEYEIFENTTQAPGSTYAPGSWPALLTAPYTFVNQTLFNFYGAGAFSGTSGITGTALQKVNLNTSQRLGVLLQGAVMAGTTTTNLTNPVLRGSFVINKLMCRGLGLPTDPDTLAKATTPVPYTGWTARERYSAHAAQPVCKACHQFLDPIGLALENYDAVGLYRTMEHATINGETRDTAIDASGSVPGVTGTANGGVELVKLLATSDEMNTCFANHWIEFAYGREMEAADACNKQTVQTAFKNSGYNIKQMLLAITQTDGFLSRPAQ